MRSAINHLKKYLFLPLLFPKVSIMFSISSFKILSTYSLSICNNAKLESLSWRMLFLKYVFNLLKDEKERSAEHEVACITAKIFRAFENSGNIFNAPIEWIRWGFLMQSCQKEHEMTKRIYDYRTKPAYTKQPARPRQA